MIPISDIQTVINFLRGQGVSWRAFMTSLSNLIKFGAGFLPDTPVTPSTAMVTNSNPEILVLDSLEKVLQGVEETRFQAAFDPSIWISLLPVLLELFGRFLNRGR